MSKETVRTTAPVKGRRNRANEAIDLRDVDWSAVDLAAIDAETRAEGAERRIYSWGASLLWAMAFGTLLWLPSSELYRTSGEALFFFVAGGAALVGIFGGRFLWRWVQEAAERHAQKLALEGFKPPPKKPSPPSALTRALTLMGAAGLATAIVWLQPDGGYTAGDGGYTNGWVAAVRNVSSVSCGSWPF